MAADNVIANPGTGGATFRTLADTNSAEWPGGILGYVTTLAAGANVIKEVTPTAGLPVQAATNSAAFPVSGTVTLSNPASSNVAVVSALPTGTNSIGAVTEANLDATIASAGTNTAAKLLVVGGKTSDATPQDQPVPLTNGGAAVKTDGSATTQPVSGTLTVQQSTAANLKVDLSGTAANATAVKVDGSAVTQPVSAASLPLPAGASTAAKQPALGTAGSASSDVITVQGIASMLALKVDGSAVTQPVSASSLPLPAGASTAAKQPALGTAGTAASDVITVQGIASMTALKVDGSAVTQPVSGTLTVTQATAANLNAVIRLNDGSGNSITQGQKTKANSLPVALASDQDALPITDNAGSLTVDNAGTFAVQAAQSGTWTVQPGNTQNTTPWLTANQAATSGGCDSYSFLSTAAVQAAAIKASAGQVYGISGFNNSTNIAYVRLYNQTASPATTDGANIVWRGMIPGNSNGAGFTLPLPPGQKFGTGIGIRVTAAIADNDATALAANAIMANVLYK